VPGSSTGLPPHARAKPAQVNRVKFRVKRRIRILLLVLIT
jgi:hypothetical protein